MSSKRGRKRNDNLPPNRARDVQRAFRARRAAHLQSLEQRVTELEEENNCLRQALNLPPANRPPLGKGPTGKDRPKSFDPTGLTTISMKSRDSSDSPSSTRRSSLSPESTPLTMGSRSAQLDDSAWEQTIVMSDSHESDVASSASSSYPLPPMSAPPPSKPVQYNPYPNSAPSPLPRNSVPNSMYLNPQTNYSHHADRSVSSSYPSPSFTAMRIDQREDPRTQYNYSPAPYENASMHNSPPSQPMHSQAHPRDPSLPYPTRRSMTEPQVSYTLDSGFPHLPNPMSHQGIRLPSPPRLQDSGSHHTHMPLARHVYNAVPDGRTHSMS